MEKLKKADKQPQVDEMIKKTCCDGMKSSTVNNGDDIVTGKEFIKNECEKNGMDDIPIVARVFSGSGYGFYNAKGDLVLPTKYQWLKNNMYPNNGEFDFNFYLRKGKEENRLFYIDKDGAVDLGEVVDAIPLSKDLVAVCRRRSLYGVLDKNGKIVLEANRFGKIIGISKNGYKVCEIEPDIYGLVDDKGKIVDDKHRFDEYVVNPSSNLLCGIQNNDDNNKCIYIINTNNKVDFYEIVLSRPECSVTKVYVYNKFVVVERLSKSGKSTNTLLLDVSMPKSAYYEYDGVVVKQSENWKGQFYIGHEESYQLSSTLRNLKAKFVSYKNDILVVSRKQNYIINCDYNHWFKKMLVSCKNASFVTTDNRAIVFGIVKNDKIEYNRLKNYGDSYIVGLSDAITMDDSIVIRYSVQRQSQNQTQTHNHTIVVDLQGKIIIEDHFNQFEFLSGPVQDKYYYLSNGELFQKRSDETEGVKQSDCLSAEMMWPLGQTEHFLIKKDNEYQIIDSSGTILGKPFNIVSGIDMDSLCNSKYIPIVNTEGKFGRVDTDGHVIVPCEYSEVLDL